MVVVRPGATARGDDDGAGAEHTEEPSGSTRDSVVALDVPDVPTRCETLQVQVSRIQREYLRSTKELLCSTTPRRASVATNGLWRVAARAWHEPPADACSVVSAHPSHLDR